MAFPAVRGEPSASYTGTRARRRTRLSGVDGSGVEGPAASNFPGGGGRIGLRSSSTPPNQPLFWTRCSAVVGLLGVNCVLLRHPPDVAAGFPVTASMTASFRRDSLWRDQLRSVADPHEIQGTPIAA